MEKTDYPQQDFQPSFDAYSAQRADLVAVLTALAPEDWSRTATVTGAGKPLERTVLSYAGWMATHERPHIKQIQRVANALRA